MGENNKIQEIRLSELNDLSEEHKNKASYYYFICKENTYFCLKHGFFGFDKTYQGEIACGEENCCSNIHKIKFDDNFIKQTEASLLSGVKNILK